VGVLALALIVPRLSGGGGGGAVPAAGDATAKIRVGIRFDWPGIGLKTGDGYSGLDVDVATYIAGKLGKQPGQIEWVQAFTADRETLISTEQVEYVVATYSITDARKQSVSFAGPYLLAGQDLLVRSQDASIAGPASLVGKRLCSVAGSAAAQKLQTQYPGIQLVELGTYAECVSGLIVNSVDALTTDDAILAGLAGQEAFKGKVRVVGKPFSQERYGIGLKKGDVAFCNQVTDALKAMVADGSWQRFVDKNLGPGGYSRQASSLPTPDACN